MRAEGEGGKGEGEGGKGRVAVLRLLPLLQDRQGDREGEGRAGGSSEKHSLDSNPPGSLTPGLGSRMSLCQELANFSSLLHQLSSMGCTSDIHEVTSSLPSFSYVCIFLTGIGEGVGYDPIPERVNEAVVFELGEPRGSSSGDKSVRSGLKKLFIINHQQ